MTASTRRAALGAILAAPLTGGAVMALPSGSSQPVAAAADFPESGKLPAVSPELVRLIAKHDRIDAMLKASVSDDGVEYDQGLMRAAGAMRARVLSYPASGLPDILAKVACVARLWPLSDLREEVAQAAQSGRATIDDMVEGIVLELALLAEGTLCA